MWLISFKTAKWLGNWNRNSNKTQQKININFFVCWKQKHTTSNIACIHTPSESNRNRNRKWNFILLVNFKIRRCSAFVRRRSTVVGSNGWMDGRTDDSVTNVRTDIDCFSHLGFFFIAGLWKMRVPKNSYRKIVLNRNCIFVSFRRLGFITNISKYLFKLVASKLKSNWLTDGHDIFNQKEIW